MEEEYGIDPSICGILETEKVGSRQVGSKGDKSFSYKDLAPHKKPYSKIIIERASNILGPTFSISFLFPLETKQDP